MRRAKAICNECVVRAECLDWAIDNLPYGIAGGMTERERYKEGRRRRARRQA